ncbi:carbohydrate-binding module family 13 protein [Rhizophagus clarus]|uniref:Carbohydrate-binding module family 13 protein n=1 Tax=Rhizophagus clarus TaxID=94130 RepID=A0A8H3M2A4_9GLOM|nr:carbohydrate-binding module family 13 protein [Rhizophagus clarus]
MDNNKFLPKLSQNLLEILEDDEYYDITIEVANKDKSDGTLTRIELSNISPEIFQILLRYIYGGRLSFKGHNVTDVIKTLVAACELDLQELVNHLQSYLIKNSTTWLEKNFNLTYRTSFGNDSLLELQNFCNDLTSKKPDKIFESDDFSSIPEDILISLIQNVNLKMNEVQVWKNILKWGINQNPGLPPDSASFSADDFSVLKNTLQQCIPYIKFYNLTAKEFLENVFPYRKILPEDLFMDLLKLFLDHDYKPIDRSESEETKEIKSKTEEVNEAKATNIKIKIEEANEGSSTNTTSSTNTRPNNTKRSTSTTRSTNATRIDSNIITKEHVRLISTWINRSNVNASYEFRLLHRGSRDGFDRKVFHNLCDHQSSTVTVIKVKGSSEILGGYNPIEWKSDSKYATSYDSFIFSFNKNQGVENHILSRVWDCYSAISNDPNRGPSFGRNDLVMRGNFYGNCCCMIFSYEKPIRNSTDKFSVEEYEVFKVTKI